MLDSIDLNNIKFGRIEDPDDRDANFPVSQVLRETPEVEQKYWWANGWWGNQGSTSMCVAYSWTHWFEDGPVIQDVLNEDVKKPAIDVNRFYKECQYRDRWPGENYNGTSVRAGAKVLKELGIISEYRWANTVEDMVNTISLIGPMVVGTRWYKNMNHPNSQGMLTLGGGNNGGHAYVINGVDKEKELFRIKNSWGRRWGNQGFAYISFEDFNKLLKNGGEACVAFENKINEAPNFDDLKAV